MDEPLAYTPHAILQPAAVLIAWTLLMLGWMLATRMPALRRAGISLGQLTGSKAADADRSLPRKAQWKAHNYNHLMEQPTLFYAVVGIIALTGTGYRFNVALAWSYVGLRIAHSVWQSTINRVDVRFALFIASSLALAALTLHALMAVF